jgi:Spy/CpxP family protein refolding chaperone
MKNKTAISTLLIVLIFSATSAFAWQGHGNKGGNCDRRGEGMSYEQHEERMENRLGKMAVILDLTKEQQEKIEGLSENNWKERQELRSKMQANRDALRAYRSSNDVDVDEFRAKARQQADLKADMMAQKVEHRAAIFAIMTPEQQKKAEQLWEMRGNKHGQRGFGQKNCDRDCGKQAGSGCRQSS